MKRIATIFLVIAITFTGVVLAAVAKPSSTEPGSGDALYAKGKFPEAVAAYQLELKATPDSARLRTNLACALYQVGRHNDAIREWQTALPAETDSARAARIYYNIGNSYFTTGDRSHAIEAYKAALRINPDDSFAKYNLEIALKEQQPPPPSPRNNPNSQSPNNNSGENPPPPSPDQPPDRKPPQNGNAPSQMTKDEAERILDALRQTEHGPGHQTNPKDSHNTTMTRDW